jgi:DNA-binding response OmpR family regulator
MPGRLVVIADKDHGMRRMLEAALTVQHFRTVTASDAAQTMELSRHERPELIVASVGTPRPDGFAVIQQLKSDPATANIPVLAVAAVPSLDLQQRARAAGFDAVLIKPITATTLSDVAHMLIERAALLQARSERLLAPGATRVGSGDAPSPPQPSSRAASTSLATHAATPRCRRCGSDAQCTLVRTTRSSVTYHCGACGHTWRLTFKTPLAEA